MIGIKIMHKIYQNREYLEYLRYHPEWYKILYHDESKIDEFINVCKKDLKLTFNDRLEKIKDQMLFLNSIKSFLTKK